MSRLAVIGQLNWISPADFPSIERNTLWSFALAFYPVTATRQD